MTICRVHDSEDVVPGRICGRPLPCGDHEMVAVPRYVITARKPGKLVRLTRTGVAAAFTCVERLRELGYKVYVVRTAEESVAT